MVAKNLAQSVMEDFDRFAPPVEGPKGNTVFGMPEPVFRKAWIHALSMAMLKRGKGFRMDSPKRAQPKGAARWRGERRDDKQGTTKLSRQLLARAR